VVLAETLLLGQNLLAWLVLAFGGALFVGNVLAVVRPPSNQRTNQLPRPPLSRSLIMAAIGLVAAVWALASIIKA
jgi:hypothetical protein